ncbi:putative GntR family transcriptional regulator [Microlunatus phosphovorus NM-1]|uniref:Putative GntR family transcriptional regulator n=1 Tax=Microlunatus phosphovorus (strain ATCC 700054 / DSM 10555 / JCM 9379 / NBRC 101784 / NCIMB 13414 / VKM Ac-1990 / NM-1) TaxID=1032480 RepID=F5XHU1_MICPN|nr:GntR family transcriptional regulator [Microlunatus phosphovorus]BAK33236.1 putative GntR family transcriptional regulator [Microlunatus phosphovorus NM-1]
MPATFRDGAFDKFDNRVTFDDGGLHLPDRAHHSSLRDQVTEALRAALIAGQMKPGVLYSAPAIAEMLGVSATPVREAMLDLVKEDLVVPIRNKGFRVTELSDRELDELTEARLLLEVPTMGAVAAAYESSMEPELTRLRALARDLEAAAATDEITRYLQLDTEFHTRFLALHGNNEIVRVVRQLRSRSRLFGLEALARSGKLVESTREHMQMIDLAVARDRSGLEELTRVHLSHTRTIWATDQARRSATDPS